MPAYNRIGAVEYALKFALNYNTEYATTHRNDCANFVSQALFVGGWPMVQGDRTSSSAWFYDYGIFDRPSYSWTGAHNLRLFIENSRRAKLVTNPMELDPGDVVQIANPDGQTWHSMFVTGKTGDDLLLSYHTNDTRDKPLKKVKGRALFQGGQLGVVFLHWRVHDRID